MQIEELVEKLKQNRDLSDEEFRTVIEDSSYDTMLQTAADEVRRRHYGTDVYIRGLIEFTNYCKNNCYYCGIRRDNEEASRYRLTKEDILSCTALGYELGYRTFVLQGGEDLSYSDRDICEIVAAVKKQHSDCAVTLSIGEKSKESYKAYYEAGADRYLLRHETASNEHYARLHPKEMSLSNRKRCLCDLKEIGYQVGAGFMVGSPYQTVDNLIEDIRFLQDLSPDMIGIGPFLSHKNTPFCNESDGKLQLTLKLLSILRLCFPYVLLPATTALGTVAANGRELGLKAGANVVMPNLSPVAVRKKYELYDNKICTGEEAAECKDCLANRVAAAGYRIVVDKGDVKRV